jgi:hypothetical protein
MMTCNYQGCDKEARVALRTTRPTRSDLKTTVYWDNRTAPATAEELCAKHAVEVLGELAAVLA